jgi:endonuclease YncB( thermonuclease family)
MGRVKRSLVAIELLAALSVCSAAHSYEFGCLDPSHRDGSFFVQGGWEVIDGDTVRVGSFTVNLISIDAPEIGQTCLSSAGTRFDCGSVVRQMLEEKFRAAGPLATCLVHFPVTAESEGEGFCGTFGVDPHFKVKCVQQDFGGELARDGYAVAGAVGEFPTSSLYWAGHEARDERRGLFAGEILPQ